MAWNMVRKHVRPLNRILKFPWIIFDLKLCHEINQLMGKISWEICDSFGSILGQRPFQVVPEIFDQLCAMGWNGIPDNEKKHMLKGNMWWYTRTRNNQTNDGFGDLASLLKSMKVDWVHERNHRCPFPAGWFHGKVPYYWRILVLKKW